MDRPSREAVEEMLAVRLAQGGILPDDAALVLAALPSEPPSDPERLARLFHETYERLAPSFGYETRKASAVPWDDVPENNRRLMIAVAGEVLAARLNDTAPETPA